MSISAEAPLTHKEAAGVFCAEVLLQVPIRCQEHRGDIPSPRMGRKERSPRPLMGPFDIQNAVGMEFFALFSQWTHMFGDTLTGTTVFRMASDRAMRWLRENPWIEIQAPKQKSSRPDTRQQQLFP